MDKLRIAAVGDIHVAETDHNRYADFFKHVSDVADVLLLCGDLTDTGKVTEAELLHEQLRMCRIPVVGVLGNHDFEGGQQDEIKKVLNHEPVHILDGESVVIKDVGFAGVKGFAGGFDSYMLSSWGENKIKEFVQEAVDEALKLDKALTKIDSEYALDRKIAVLHYSPIRATVVGENEEIFPFLGCSRLMEPINRRNVKAAFHGHAHHGTLEGKSSHGIPVFNVSQAILKKIDPEKLYYLFEV